MKNIIINWIHIIKEHMQKAMRLSDYRYPYAVWISKFLHYFEELMMNRLDSFVENQRNLHDLCVSNFQRIDNRFDSMDTRFMTLDEQIEAVHNQIFDLQYADDDE